MKPLLLFFGFVVNLTISFAQNSVGIGTNTPQASALLDVSSTTKGLLTPRMTTVQRNAIASPAKGLLVYDTDLNSLFHFNGSVWGSLSSEGGAFTLPFNQNTDEQNPAFRISNTGTGAAITGVTTNEFGTAVSGIANSLSGYGIFGSAAASATAIYGSSENGVGVKAASTSGIALDARSINNSAIKASIVLGANLQPAIIATHAGSAPAVEGISQTGYGIRGATTTASSTGAAVYGINNGTAGNGVFGVANFASGHGVQGSSSTGTGVYGYSNSNKGVAGGTISGTALYGNSTTGYGLEVSGKVKIAGGNTNPSNGAVLTSDASGNAVWKNNSVAFSVEAVNSNYLTLPNNSWRRVQFGGTENYDFTNSYTPVVGTNYNPNTSSTFTVPVAGVYHFDVSVQMFAFAFNNTTAITGGDIILRRNRGGTVTSLYEKTGGEIYIQEGYSYLTISLSKDILLQSGDVLYVEVRQKNADGRDMNIDNQTYFNGSLIIAQ